jgi:DNA-binding NarL/FixJ family response regulator
MSASSIRSDRVRIVLADSATMRSQLLCGALRRRPEFSVTVCPMSSDDLLKSLKSSAADVLLVNVDHGNDLQRDLAIIHHLHLAYPGFQKILIVDKYDRRLTVDSFRSGVQGIFSFSDSKFRDLCKCIHAVHAGQIWANSVQLRYILDLVSNVPSLRMLSAKGSNLLTPREEQVVALVTDGMTNREVAIELGLREHTIKTYLFRIFEKLGISSRVELVLYAMAQGKSRAAEWIAGSASTGLD